MSTTTRPKHIPLLVAMANEGKTTVALAKGSGLHRVTISSLLNGRSLPTRETASLIARELGVQVGDIFSELYVRGGAA